jgi:hypothetical protein
MPRKYENLSCAAFACRVRVVFCLNEECKLSFFSFLS